MLLSSLIPFPPFSGQFVKLFLRVECSLDDHDFLLREVLTHCLYIFCASRSGNRNTLMPFLGHDKSLHDMTIITNTVWNSQQIICFIQTQHQHQFLSPVSICAPCIALIMNLCVIRIIPVMPSFGQQTSLTKINASLT